MRNPFSSELPAKRSGVEKTGFWQWRNKYLIRRRFIQILRNE